MPNWCANEVTIHNMEEQPTKDLVKAADKGELLNWILPMPEKLKDTEATLASGEGWYSWRVNNWGTKWDVESYYIDHYKKGNNYVIELSFDSAWSPPRAAMNKLKELYPQIEIEHYYFEPGCDYVGYNDNDYSPWEIYQAWKRNEYQSEEIMMLDDRFRFIKDFADYDEEEEDENENRESTSVV